MSDLSMPRNDFPHPCVPISPILSWGTFRYRSSATPTVLDGKFQILTTSGRSAIALALKEIGISEGDEVLVPALHCTSMVEPIVWLKAKPVFFQINEDCSANLSILETLVTDNTKAILVAHYFGFLQNISPIREFCDRNNIALVEDCAHTFFGGTAESPIGNQSDYMIASTLKFFPIFDGGCLASYRHPILGSKIAGRNIRFELKSFFNCLERSINYGRFKVLSVFIKKLFKFKDFIWSKIKKDGSEIQSPAAAEGGFGFDPGWVNKPISLFSLLVLKSSGTFRIEFLRRKNYERWDEVLRDIPGGVPLFSALPGNTVPHVYPFLVNEPEIVFPILKNLGMPILRFGEFLWGGVDESICPVSDKLSKHCFQFPCHQELKDDELEWMINIVTETLLNLNSEKIC